MADTKERILTAALELFARSGYEAVSVADIAGALGMTKGALYRHYESKRAIFDAIVARMVQIDAARAREYAVPEQSFEAAPESYPAALSALRDFTLAQFDFWTSDAFAAPFRRMLALEQYRSAEMAQLYMDCLVTGPVSYTEDIFRESMAVGAMRPGDAGLLALEYCAPLFLLISAADHRSDAAQARSTLAAHLDRFAAAHIQ